MDNLEQEVLAEFKKLEQEAVALVDKLGASRELSLVKTKVQEARLWLQEHIGL